jgi:hypothetical protein
MSVGFNVGMGNGTESASESEAKVENAVLSELDAQIEPGVDPRNYYNAVKPGWDAKKDIWGGMKEPTAAKFKIRNMITNEIVAVSNKFLLTGVNRETREKFQILYGFDEQWMLSSFGKDVPMFGIVGVLINLKGDKDWVRDFHLFYETYMRDSVLVKNKRQVELHYSNRMIRGYPVAKTEYDDSANETFVQFNMSMLVRQDKVSGRSTEI